MTKLKRRPTLREQVDRLKRQNEHLKAQARAWKCEWEDAHDDFVTMTRFVEQIQKLVFASGGLMERHRALLKLTARDPTMPLQ